MGGPFNGDVQELEERKEWRCQHGNRAVLLCKGITRIKESFTNFLPAEQHNRVSSEATILASIRLISKTKMGMAAHLY